MKTRTRTFALGLTMTLLGAGPALAGPTERAVDDAARTKMQAPFAGSAIASDETLNQATAREDLSVVAESRQTSNVSNNSVNGNSVTGEVRLGDNALQNATGLTIINANSGNNVSMNASINVNIVSTPPQQ